MAEKRETVVMPYGSEQCRAKVPALCLGILDVKDVPSLMDPGKSVLEALANPIGQDRSLFDTVQAGETVALVVSDSFRQTRCDEVLPPLVSGLATAGIRDEDVSITFSTGTHRAPTADEQRSIVGDGIYEDFEGRLFSHDPRDQDNLVYLGETSRGTRVEINRRVHEADRIVVIGAVVLHYFGGFGGGRKSVVPGLASVATIAHNHAMNLDPNEDTLNPHVGIGILDGNPVAEDMLEGSLFTHVDCVVNTVLNREGCIARIFAGDMDASHREAAAYAADLFTVPIPARADLVIAASPSTLNFVQTHKALFNAYQALKPGGRIVMLAPCKEGLGGDQFVKWLRLSDRTAIIAELRRQSEINGQTALSTIEKGPATFFVTEMNDDEVATLRGRKAATFQEAVDRALAELPRGEHAEPTYYAMPSATYTVPAI